MIWPDIYISEVYVLRTKCKTIAKNLPTTLRKVFDGATSGSLFACEISFLQCELTMYRARKMVEPKVPLGASEFVEIIHTTAFGKYFKFGVTSGGQTTVEFFSDQISGFLSEVIFYSTHAIYTIMDSVCFCRKAFSTTYTFFNDQKKSRFVRSCDRQDV